VRAALELKRTEVSAGRSSARLEDARRSDMGTVFRAEKGGCVRNASEWSEPEDETGGATSERNFQLLLTH
jgi:hypothetical protein